MGASLKGFEGSGATAWPRCACATGVPASVANNAARPLPREVATDWWREAEKLAELEHAPRMGFHSARRKFANDLKPTTNLRDLAYMGGWKSAVTLLTVYQQPDLEVQRASLAGRKNVGAAPQSLVN
jgi:hypothetical protein